MSRESLLLFLADAILVLHVLFVAFVVLGLLAIYLGWGLGWTWVRNRAFRTLHLCAIGVVVIQAWGGIVCPLTTWEMRLRSGAGEATYQGSFIRHWLQSLIYYEAPDWVFLALYTGFGSMVLLAWYLVRPGSRGGQ